MKESTAGGTVKQRVNGLSADGSRKKRHSACKLAKKQAVPHQSAMAHAIKEQEFQYAYKES